MVFTGVMAAVMEVTLNFMGEAECPVDVSGVRRCNDENTEDVSNGVLIDRQRIEVLFDQLEQVYQKALFVIALILFHKKLF